MFHGEKSKKEKVKIKTRNEKIVKTDMDISGVHPEILKRSGALCRSPWLADEGKFRFQIVQKGQNNVRN